MTADQPDAPPDRVVDVMAAPSIRTVPAVGDRLSFRYPDSRGFAHRFYSSWPGNDGHRVSQNETYVELHGEIVVREVKRVEAFGHEWVTVQFQNPFDGVDLWTSYSKGRQVWMVNGSTPRRTRTR